MHATSNVFLDIQITYKYMPSMQKETLAQQIDLLGIASNHIHLNAMPDAMAQVWQSALDSAA